MNLVVFDVDGTLAATGALDAGSDRICDARATAGRIFRELFRLRFDAAPSADRRAVFRAPAATAVPGKGFPRPH